MSRPKNKTELLELGKANFEKLIAFVDSLSDDEQGLDFPPGTLNRNIRDVLMHLHHWHLMMEDWYTQGKVGEKPIIPAKGYTWKTLPSLNNWIREKYKEVSLYEAKLSLKISFNQIREIITSISDPDLFEKKKYAWTGTTSMGAYFISATSSHYDWALKLIKKAKKT
ncbi:hypothetical protein SAMN06298216_1370 [Spirosomataceae bacterium TFI 002]|nr:hypothetical protein SAMN06298216_1370 [Spirosomataceae bacterium TFI 002]